MTISELKKNVGVNGIGVSGKLVKIYDRKSGQSEKDGKTFEWSFQNLIIEDETGKLTVTLKGRDKFNATLGGQIEIQSITSPKYGKIGVKITEEEHQGVKTIKAIVTPSALIRLTPAAMPETSEDEPQSLSEEKFVKELNKPAFDKEIADKNKDFKEFLKELHELISKAEENLI